jgi:transposase
MAVVAFYDHRVLTYEVLNGGETMTGVRFQAFLQNSLYPVIRRRHIQHPIILMDNARPHFANVVTEYMDLREWELLRQDPYSPDQQPCDYDGFARLKLPLRGRRFANRQDLIDAFDRSVIGVNEDKSFKGIERLPSTWNQIQLHGGDYVT